MQNGTLLLVPRFVTQLHATIHAPRIPPPEIHDTLLASALCDMMTNSVYLSVSPSHIHTLMLCRNNLTQSASINVSY